MWALATKALWENELCFFYSQALPTCLAYLRIRKTVHGGPSCSEAERKVDGGGGGGGASKPSELIRGKWWRGQESLASYPGPFVMREKRH